MEEDDHFDADCKSGPPSTNRHRQLERAMSISNMQQTGNDRDVNVSCTTGPNFHYHNTTCELGGELTSKAAAPGRYQKNEVQATVWSSNSILRSESVDDRTDTEGSVHSFARNSRRPPPRSTKRSPRTINKLDRRGSAPALSTIKETGSPTVRRRYSGYSTGTMPTIGHPQTMSQHDNHHNPSYQCDNELSGIAKITVVSNSTARETADPEETESWKPMEGVVHTRTASAPSHPLQKDRILVELIANDEKESMCASVVIGQQQSLHDALDTTIQKWHLSKDSVEVFLEGSSTALPLHSPSCFLGGRKIYLKAKSEEKCTSTTIALTVVHESNEMINTLSTPTSNSRKASLPNVMTRPLRAPSFMTRTRGSKQSSSHQLTPPGNVTAPNIAQSAGTSHSSGTALQDDDATDTSSVVMLPITSQPDTISKRARHSTNRIGALFGKDKHEMLHRLQQYKDNGQTSCDPCSPKQEIPPPIESNWTKIVSAHDQLTKKECEQQEALWELVTTEYSYIQLLEQLTHIQGYMSLIQRDGYLKDINPKNVFHNISEIYKTNLRFWRVAIERMLEDSRKSGKPLNSVHLTEGFADIDRWCHSYIQFNLEYVTMHFYVQKKQKDNEMFREFAMWSQTLEACRRLKLEDLLCSPMQRLTKYHLLLKAVMKNTTDPEGRSALQFMIEKTEEAAGRLNFELFHKQQIDTLVNVMQSIESYDAVEGANEQLDKTLKSFHIDLTRPIPFCGENKWTRRMWLRGDLKLKDGYNKIDTNCYLFTDMFMICKNIGRKGDRVRMKVIRPPYFIQRVTVKELTDSIGFSFIYTNEFEIPAAAYAFQTVTAEETLKWLELFQMAKQEYRSLSQAPDMSNSLRVPPMNVPSGSTGRRSSEHMLAANSNRLMVERSSSRRMSIGSVFDQPQQMSLSSRQEYSSADIDNTTSTVNHRKCSSMDSTLSTNRNDTHSGDIHDLSASRHELKPSKNADLEIKSMTSRASSAVLSESHSAIDISREPMPQKQQNQSSSGDLRRSSEGISDGTSMVEQLKEQTRSRSNSVNSQVSHHHNETEKTGEIVNALSISTGQIPSADIDQKNESRNETEGKDTFPSETPSTEATSVKQYSAPHNRRGERRYYTADAIEQMKPKSIMYANGILKRFSMNVSNSVNSRQTGHRKNESIESNETSRNNATSNESFSSSTSGVSSSSSQHLLDHASMDLTKEVDDNMADTDNDSIQTVVTNVSTVTVNDMHTKDGNIAAPGQHSLHIKLTHTTSDSPPPLPSQPPPTLQLDSAQPKLTELITPIILTDSPTPTDDDQNRFVKDTETVCDSNMNKTVDVMSFPCKNAEGIPREITAVIKSDKMALLQMILDNGLETSLVTKIESENGK